CFVWSSGKVFGFFGCFNHKSLSLKGEKTYSIKLFLEEGWAHIFNQKSAVLGRFLTPQVST
ncbi:MAG TPA: hypothetical protein DHV52_04465, partial [Parachlamydiales bacterium]|nr:hypothetical protein [Parachlamydiales bacterium]